MARPARPRRPAFTLIEVLAVLAVMIIVAAVLIPSLAGFRGDTRQRAAADVIRAELASARARAKDEGRPYRVALHESRTRIRRAPDDTNFSSAAASSTPGGSAMAVDYTFEHVTAELVSEADAPVPDAIDGWVTLANVQPDGSCLQSAALVAVKQDEEGGVYLRLRGLTCTLRTVPKPAGAR
jgi:type II secretion system protein H